jgi:hypothetical protein
MLLIILDMLGEQYNYYKVLLNQSINQSINQITAKLTTIISMLNINYHPTPHISHQRASAFLLIHNLSYKGH